MKHLLLMFFVWFGTKVIGFPLVDIYSPGESENVVAVTFSHSEMYLDKVQDIEL
jgi:hypothetical protein